jgi:hypothetical protein
VSLGTDARGRVVETPLQSESAARDVAATTAASLQHLLGTTLEVVELQVTTVPPDAAVALVSIADDGPSGRTHLTGIGTADRPTAAARRAVIDALAPDGDLVAAGLERHHRAGRVLAGMIGDAAGERAAVGDDAAMAPLRRLLATLIEPGRIRVRTTRARYWALFTGELDVAFVTPPGVDVRVMDRWVDAVATAVRG